MKKIALHWKILIGMAMGIVFALAVLNFAWGSSFIVDWIKPFGTIFISSLKLIAVPLILSSLIKGIAALKDLSQLSKIGGKTIAVFMATTIMSVTLGILIVNLLKPGNSLSEATRTELLNSYSIATDESISAAGVQQNKGPLQMLVDLVPDNILHSASDNKNMLQVVFFALFFGISLMLIPEDTGKTVKHFFVGLNDVILKMIDLIMLAAPYGVFALLAALVAEAPSTELFLALGMYAFTVLIGLCLIILFYTLGVWFFAKKTPRFFLKGIAPAQLMAFSTSSSAATLPVTMERVEKHLGVKKEVSSFVLPIGTTINMDGTSLYQAVAALFIAQAFGIELTLSQQIGVVVTATLASIGAAAVPGAGMVMLVIVLSQAGIPEAGLALIFAVDRPLDMCRTVVNVTGDAAISMVVGKSVGMLEEVPEAQG